MVEQKTKIQYSAELNAIFYNILGKFHRCSAWQMYTIWGKDDPNQMVIPSDTNITL